MALLQAASADSRLKGPSDGSTPLHWPLAVAAARAQLQHALGRLNEQEQLRAVLRDYLDASDACTLAAADREAWEQAHARREEVRKHAREVLGGTARAPDTLSRIMALQAVENRTAEQEAALYALETEWHNRAIDPRECPVRR